MTAQRRGRKLSVNYGGGTAGGREGDLMKTEDSWSNGRQRLKLESPRSFGAIEEDARSSPHSDSGVTADTQRGGELIITTLSTADDKMTTFG